MEIKHLTITTGDMRISTPADIDKGIYFMMHNVIKQAQTEEGASLFNGTHLTMAIEGGSYSATLFYNQHPVLSSFGIKNKSDLSYFWNHIKSTGHDSCERVDIPPEPPCIIDRIYPSCMLCPEILSWSGDMTKCLGWAVMFPEFVR